MAKGCMAVSRGCHPQKANISVSGGLQIVELLFLWKEHATGLANQCH